MGKTTLQGPLDRHGQARHARHRSPRRSALAPDRPTELLASTLQRRLQQGAEVDQRVTALQSDGSRGEAEAALPYDRGRADRLDDILKERIADLKLSRDKAKAALDRITRSRTRPHPLAPALIDAFGRVMRNNITTGEIPFWKAYIRSLIDRIDADDHVVRIIGVKATLEQAVALGASTEKAVRCFEPKWRARKDSNL